MGMTTILDGKQLAQTMQKEIAADAAAIFAKHGQRPGLAVHRLPHRADRRPGCRHDALPGSIEVTLRRQREALALPRRY